MIPKVYVGVPTAEFSRPAIFYDYMRFLEKPENTTVASYHSNSAAFNRNLIIEDAISQYCTHILFIDDDMAFPPNALTRLLAHDLDAVSGLYYNKCYPHPPVIFDRDPNDFDSFQRHYLQNGEAGVIKVDACGFGFFLVNTKVFESLEPPYVRHGELQYDKRNEDMGFCLRLGETGYQIHCDLDVVIGHMGLATFWPSRNQGQWFTTIDTGRPETISCRQKTGDILTPLTK